jgi:phthalate 4,5-cis-dihydrodiol dehydrogenase
VKLGIAGLGIASRQILTGFDRVEGVELTAVADTRTEQLSAFVREYPGVRCFTDVADMCAWSGVDAVWVATPNHLHHEHTVMAARQDKHVICEKPMAVTMAQAHAMVEAVESSGVTYVQGHSKIYRSAIRRLGGIIAEGRIGSLQQVTTLMFNDWMRRPVTPAEVDERSGGGVVFRQAPHQVDIVRFLGGGRMTSVSASMGAALAPLYPIEGHYIAHARFESGAAAAMIFSGYGNFDVRELTWGVGEGGRSAPMEELRGKRAPYRGPVSAEDKYREPAYQPDALREARYRQSDNHDFFGLTICTGTRGDVRQSPAGLLIHTEAGAEEVLVPPDRFRNGELMELQDAVAAGRPAFPDHRWGRATLEVVLAIRESARSGAVVPLRFQTDVPGSLSTPWQRP